MVLVPPPIEDRDDTTGDSLGTPHASEARKIEAAATTTDWLAPTHHPSFADASCTDFQVWPELCTFGEFVFYLFLS